MRTARFPLAALTAALVLYLLLRALPEVPWPGDACAAALMAAAVLSFASACLDVLRLLRAAGRHARSAR